MAALIPKATYWDGSFPKKYLSQLRLVSWQFRDAVDPFLFSGLKFDFKKRPLELVVQQLNDMARKQSEVFHYVKQLTIETTETQISTLINKATWTISRLDEFNIIVDAITNLPYLEDLYLDFSGLPVHLQTTNMITLHRFTQLRSFGFRAQYPSDPLATSIIQQLRMNSTKESLTSLSIDFTGHTKNKEIFHEIVNDIPAWKSLQLKQLQAHGWKLVLHPNTIPHLRSLTSLDISRMDMESHSKIWSGLMAAGIQLQKLAGPLSMSLVMYLRSYAGLEHLTVYASSRVDGKKMFSDLSQSLTFHKKTLKFFDGASEHCSLNDMVAIRECEKLHYLAVHLRGGPSNDDFAKTVAIVLEIPNLEILKIDSSRAYAFTREIWAKFRGVVEDIE
ncbi:hypothetical protein JR316_0009791 [Psilocybe cubensis]|uniref:Uncharacterized protein n=1 Tax=Psilocybe cubensis TaxID=181762 RepID=A0ACB8GQ20_PSICU|nr:hypothetical protein JR316_0009791 [Psilocybe cubensis]KAH9477569.1 hypothetical protein JR316_0009791 [Psilocybe cubensis]